jgi:hypothetical protein
MSECSVVQQRDAASDRSRFGPGKLPQPSTRVPFWPAELGTQCVVLQSLIQAISAAHGARVGSFADLEERGDRAVPEITQKSGGIVALPSDENKWFGFPHLHW